MAAKGKSINENPDEPGSDDVPDLADLPGSRDRRRSFHAVVPDTGAAAADRKGRADRGTSPDMAFPAASQPSGTNGCLSRGRDRVGGDRPGVAVSVYRPGRHDIRFPQGRHSGVRYSVSARGWLSDRIPPAQQTTRGAATLRRRRRPPLNAEPPGPSYRPPGRNRPRNPARAPVEVPAAQRVPDETPRRPMPSDDLRRIPRPRRLPLRKGRRCKQPAYLPATASLLPLHRTPPRTFPGAGRPSRIAGWIRPGLPGMADCDPRST